LFAKLQGTEVVRFFWDRWARKVSLVKPKDIAFLRQPSELPAASSDGDGKKAEPDTDNSENEDAANNAANTKKEDAPDGVDDAAVILGLLRRNDVPELAVEAGGAAAEELDIPALPVAAVVGEPEHVPEPEQVPEPVPAPPTEDEVDVAQVLAALKA
jgi:hypothetical protein